MWVDHLAALAAAAAIGKESQVGLEPLVKEMLEHLEDLETTLVEAEGVQDQHHLHQIEMVELAFILQ